MRVRSIFIVWMFMFYSISLEASISSNANSSLYTSEDYKDISAIKIEFNENAQYFLFLIDKSYKNASIYRQKAIHYKNKADSIMLTVKKYETYSKTYSSSANHFKVLAEQLKFYANFYQNLSTKYNGYANYYQEIIAFYASKIYYQNSLS